MPTRGSIIFRNGEASYLVERDAMLIMNENYPRAVNGSARMREESRSAYDFFSAFITAAHAGVIPPRRCASCVARVVYKDDDGADVSISAEWARPQSTNSIDFKTLEHGSRLVREIAFSFNSPNSCCVKLGKNDGIAVFDLRGMKCAVKNNGGISLRAPNANGIEPSNTLGDADITLISVDLAFAA